jgi:hypothetical protein
MISGKVLLPVLLGAAIGAAGWIQSSRGGGAGAAGLARQLEIAEDQIAMLERENASLRSLAQGGGEVAVPPEMIAKIEKDYGLTFLASPVFHRIAGEELGYRIEAAMESRLGPQGVDDRQEAYRWIGWLREEDDLLEQMVAVKSVGALGWFDEVTGEAWVTDRFDLKNIPDQAAMVRLLVRILLNQQFPPPSAYPGDDAARAREALHAGAAAGAEARFYAASARGIGFMPMNDNSAAARLLLTLAEFVQGVSIFPAVEGKGLADTLFVKGAEEFAKGLRKAPQNTLEIVLPGETGRGGEATLPKISDEVFLKESAGYLGLRLWLSLTEDLGMAEEVSRSWVKDGYALFADGEMSSGLVWEVTLEDAAAADTFAKAAQDLAEAMATEGRFLGTARVSETTVRFFNTATKETAAKLGMNAARE